MATFLLLETATPTCSVALSQNGRVLHLLETQGQQSHATHTTLFIQQCLHATGVALTDLDAVVVSQGPGSYTGLRIGVSVAKGICYALNKPLIAVDTLQSLAFATATAQIQLKDSLFCPMIDARRMEVYTALFDASFQYLQPTEALIVEENAFLEWFEQGKRVVFSGDGAAKCEAIIRHSNAVFVEQHSTAAGLLPFAQAAFEANHFQDVAYFEPFYLKSPHITQPKKLL